MAKFSITMATSLMGKYIIAPAFLHSGLLIGIQIVLLRPLIHSPHPSQNEPQK